jgi:hypothetical protein
MKKKDKDENQLVEEIRKDFLLKLPELSQGWEPPAFAVNLGWDYISVMERERWNRTSDTHWIKYYGMRGISPQSKQYILPSHLQDSFQSGKEDEHKRKIGITGEHIMEAVWPILKSGERPQQSGIHRFIALKRANGVDYGTNAYYWVMVALFQRWYFHVYLQYIDKYKHSNRDTAMCTDSTFEMALNHNAVLPQWFNVQRLNWWLSWQGISLKPNEIERLYCEARLSKTVADDF